MTTPALLRHGSQHAAVLLDGLSAWMARLGSPGDSALPAGALLRGQGRLA